MNTVIGKIDTHLELSLLQLVENGEIFSREIMVDQLQKTKRHAKGLSER